MDKAALRSQLAAKRDAVPLDERAWSAREAASRLAALPEWSNAQTIGLYVAIRSEMPTQPILDHARVGGKRVAIPRVVGKDLSFHLVDGFDRLTPGAFRIPEPAASDPVADPDFIVVPGLAFDTSGARLGYGSGFFDRCLAGFRGTSVGLAYDFQVLARLPQDAHDVPVRLIVTDARVVRPFGPS